MRKRMFKLFADQMKKNEMVGAFGKCRGQDMCIHGFGGEA
jgi:hypothetical protein